MAAAPPRENGGQDAPPPQGHRRLSINLGRRFVEHRFGDTLILPGVSHPTPRRGECEGGRGGAGSNARIIDTTSDLTVPHAAGSEPRSSAM